MAVSLVVFIKILSSIQLLFYFMSDNFGHSKKLHFERNNLEFASYPKPFGNGEDCPVHHK